MIGKRRLWALAGRWALRGTLLALGGLLGPACTSNSDQGTTLSVVTIRVSEALGEVQATGGPSTFAALSQDGRFVAFQSGATNLVNGDINNFIDIFVKDRQTGVVELISVRELGGQGTADSLGPDISGDGNIVAWDSTGDFGLTGTPQVKVFVRNRAKRTTVGLTDNFNQDSFSVSVSSDGRYVAFQSAATNVTGFTNPSSTVQIYVADLSVNPPALLLASAAGGVGTAGCNGSCFNPRIVGNGPSVVFWASSTNLITGGPATDQVYLSVPGTSMELVSLNNLNVPGDHASSSPSASEDGRFVCFESGAQNFGTPAGTQASIAIRDRTLGTTLVVLAEPIPGGLTFSKTPRLSGDGRFVGLATTFDLDGPSNGIFSIFFYDRLTGLFHRASVDSAGNLADANSHAPSFSRDGRWLGFDSFASNLVVGDTNGWNDVFLRGPLQ